MHLLKIHLGWSRLFPEEREVVDLRYRIDIRDQCNARDDDNDDDGGDDGDDDKLISFSLFAVFYA